MSARISKNGFREYDCRWLIDKELNEEGMEILGKAWGTQLQKDYKIKQAFVVHDYREYSQRYQDAFVKGFLSTGVDVVDLGLLITPAAYFAVYYLNIKGGAVITASHNENGWTGVKLIWGPSRTVGPPEIVRFKTLVESRDFIKGDGKLSKNKTVAQAYIADLVSAIKIDKKIKIVVSTGNGTAGLFAPEVYKKIGLEVIENHTELDWNFPYFEPNPENVEFLKSAAKIVRKNKADLAILIDGDGDRLGILDENGEIIFNDRVGLMISRELVRERPGSEFIVDMKSTGAWALDKVFDQNKGKVFYCKTGHYYVKEAMHKRKALAGFERSGHNFFGKNLGRGYDEAILSSLYLMHFLAKKNKTLSQWSAELPKSYQSPTMQAVCPEKLKYKITKKIAQKFVALKKQNKKFANQRIKKIIFPDDDPMFGVRVILENDDWGLIRASANKPVMMVVAESFQSYKDLYSLVIGFKAELANFKEISKKYDQKMSKPKS